MTKATQELSRLRNRHVAKLLTHLGEQPPYIEIAIKHSFSMFADDVQANILQSDNSEYKGLQNVTGTQAG